MPRRKRRGEITDVMSVFGWAASARWKEIDDFDFQSSSGAAPGLARRSTLRVRRSPAEVRTRFQRRALVGVQRDIREQPPRPHDGVAVALRAPSVAAGRMGQSEGVAELVAGGAGG